MKGVSPTQLTLKFLRKRRIICTISEHYNSFCKQRYDLFGFIDVVALSLLNPSPLPKTLGGNIIGIQTTRGAGNGMARVRKILYERRKNMQAWIACGGRVQVWAWRKMLQVDGNGERKRKKDGKLDRRKVWTVKIWEVDTKGRITEIEWED